VSRVLKYVLLAAALGGAAFAVVHWPRLETVETGRTPEYSDLQPRAYGAPPEEVARAVKSAIDHLAGWTFVGSGRGPGGSEVQAVAQMPVVPVKHDVFIRIRREGGRTRVSVRSASRTGEWDFGGNARVIRRLFEELDRQMATRP
jgi:uncharacterized protein (DUF1499 family)